MVCTERKWFLIGEHNKNKQKENDLPVVLVDGDSADGTVLFESAVGPQAVLTGDDTKDGSVNSASGTTEWSFKFPTIFFDSY